MTLPLQVALTVAPLACYFYVVGVWQSGNRARVIPGLLDYALLAFGVSGLLTVGPVGQVLLDLIFGIPTLFGWALWILFLLCWGWIFSGTARRRLVIYNVEASSLRQAVANAAATLPEIRLFPTLEGFEAAEAGLAIKVDASKRFRVGTVEAKGMGAEAFIARLRGPLRDEVRKENVGPTRVTWGMFALSWLTMLIPMGFFLLTEPRARAALRAFLMRVRG